MFFSTFGQTWSWPNLVWPNLVLAKLGLAKLGNQTWPNLDLAKVGLARGGEGGNVGATTNGKAGGQNFVTLVVGNATKGVDENGPDWDLNKALLRWQGGHQHVFSEIQLEALCEHLPTETRLGPVLLFGGTSP